MVNIENLLVLFPNGNPNSGAKEIQWAYRKIQHITEVDGHPLDKVIRLELYGERTTENVVMHYISNGKRFMKQYTRDEFYSQ